MPYKLTVDVIPPEGGLVRVEHVFYGDTEKECNESFDAHAAGCEFLAPAIAEDRIHSVIEEIAEDEWPEVFREDDEDE